MSVEERASAAERVLAARERYVARGVATPSLVVGRAEGARVWDVDGREFLDFAGGIACQNLGHGPSTVVASIHEQVDRYLHQCFMVGTYEPYVELCRRLDELWPGDTQIPSPSSSTRAEASRTRSRSRAPRPGAQVSSSSTAPSTAARS
jgi:4-aminobutyrate aminotransferase and related aminotransferases